MIPETSTRQGAIGFSEWVSEVDYAINQGIMDCHEFHFWDENTISAHWLMGLMKKFQNVTIVDLDIPYRVSWGAYKAAGVEEHRYGDIGVIVNFNLRLGGKAALSTGVGFLEAKRVDKEKNNYPHLKWEQLEREASNIAGHRVLLYDFESIGQASLNLQGHGFCSHFEEAPYGSVHASVAITQHILALRDRTRAIGGLGVPLGYQICTRYLRGLDLDYAASHDTIYDNIENKPGYILVVEVEDAEETPERGAPIIPYGFGPLHEPHPAESKEISANVSTPGANDLSVQHLKLDMFRPPRARIPVKVNH